MTWLSPLAADLVGFAGSFFIVLAYGYNNAAKRVDPILFNGLNLVGALLLVLSLTVNYNLPIIILEVVWMAIALYGIVKAWRTPRTPA